MISFFVFNHLYFLSFVCIKKEFGSIDHSISFLIWSSRFGLMIVLLRLFVFYPFLHYITLQTFAEFAVLDRSYSIETLEEGKFKAYIENVVSELHEHTPGGSYMGFNFGTGESKQSQLGRILREHKITVKDYSRHYEGCPILPMETLNNLLKSSESWLARDCHFLLMHAEQGGWPILAFVLSALLIYLKHYSDEQKTLEMVYKQAPPQLLELFSPLDPMPSQLRYLQYISRRNLSLEWPPIDRAVTLDRLIVRIIPDSDSLGGLRPMFRIYGQDPLTPNTSNSKLLFSTPKDKKAVRLYRKVPFL